MEHKVIGESLHSRTFADGHPPQSVVMRDGADTAAPVSPCQDGRAWLVRISLPVSREIPEGKIPEAYCDQGAGQQ